MPEIYWPAQPIVTLETTGKDSGDRIAWEGPYTLARRLGDHINVYIRLANGSNDLDWFRYAVEVVDLSNNLIYTAASFESVVSGSVDHRVRMTMTSNVLRFRIRAQNFFTYQYRENPPANYDNKRWHPEEVRYYTVFVQYHGDFSLDYVPVTILYDPPYQDWVNSVSQVDQYGTRTTVGTKLTSGTRTSSTESVSGGLSIGIPDVLGFSESFTSGDQYSGSQSVLNESQNQVTYRYEYGSTLTADNQRAIGRALWGPLSDLFLLLKNPWFKVTGDEQGDVGLSVSEVTANNTRLVIIPAHLLLRPGNDPIASRIPSTTRRRLLELDPFIRNLDLFFPDSGADLQRAVNHSPDLSKSNRAVKIGQYSLSPGVVLDLSTLTDIALDDSETKETLHASEVSETRGMSSAFQAQYFFLGGEIGASGTTTNSRFVQTAYQASHESTTRLIKTARCHIIRNQNEASLEDVQIWWDKQFSTFMFRKLKKLGIGVVGTLRDVEGVRLAGVEVQLSSDAGSFTATTDKHGRFEVADLDPGRFVLRVGKTTLAINLTKADQEVGLKDVGTIRNVRPVINLNSCALWQLASILRVPLPQARRIQRAWLRQNKRTTATFFATLRKERLDITELRNRAAFKVRA